VGAGHGYRLHHHGHSAVHRAPAHLKVLALIGFTLLVVLTPREWYAVFGGHLLVLLGVIAWARVPFGFLARRMVIELPFVVFALMMPFVATHDGWLSAWGLLAKGTLGVLASLTLAATTEPTDLLEGLRRLRLPALVVDIMAFMIRYLDVVTADLQRMLVAMRSRGCDPRSPRHWGALARSLGALFIRSYERGERVHVAMLSRGHTTESR
jgi:cobalt/nickel transport system permease protein